MFPYEKEIDMRQAMVQGDQLFLQQQMHQRSSAKTPRSDDECKGLTNPFSKRMRWSDTLNEVPNLSK
jgi:hypothetical protein